MKCRLEKRKIIRTTYELHPLHPEGYTPHSRLDIQRQVSLSAKFNPRDHYHTWGGI